MNKYDLDSLIRKFEEHSEEYVNSERERCERQQCVYIDNFNLCKALQSICEEIDELKSWRHRVNSD